MAYVPASDLFLVLTKAPDLKTDVQKRFTKFAKPGRLASLPDAHVLLEQITKLLPRDMLKIHQWPISYKAAPFAGGLNSSNRTIRSTRGRHSLNCFLNLYRFAVQAQSYDIEWKAPGGKAAMDRYLEAIFAVDSPLRRSKCPAHCNIACGELMNERQTRGIEYLMNLVTAVLLSHCVGDQKCHDHFRQAFFVEAGQVLDSLETGETGIFKPQSSGFRFFRK